MDLQLTGYGSKNSVLPAPNLTHWTDFLMKEMIAMSLWTGSNLLMISIETLGDTQHNWQQHGKVIAKFVSELSALLSLIIFLLMWVGPPFYTLY
jgi:hypothetical protein